MALIDGGKDGILASAGDFEKGVDSVGAVAREGDDCVSAGQEGGGEEFNVEGEEAEVVKELSAVRGDEGNFGVLRVVDKLEGRTGVSLDS